MTNFSSRLGKHSARRMRADTDKITINVKHTVVPGYANLLLLENGAGSTGIRLLKSRCELKN